MVVNVTVGEKGAPVSMCATACAGVSDGSVEFVRGDRSISEPVATVDGVKVTGDVTIARAICAAFSPCLLGGDDPLRATLVDAWSTTEACGGQLPDDPQALSNVLETRLQMRTFVVGSNFTLADAVVFFTIAGLGGSFPCGVHTERWRNHISRHSGVAAVVAWARVASLEDRVAALELSYSASAARTADSGGGGAGTPVASTSSSSAVPTAATDPPTTETHARLHKLCEDSGLRTWRFKRVPGDYYDWTLEQRRAALGAASVDHLTKSLILKNTAGDADDPYLHVLVLVQYTAKLDTATLNKFIKARRKREDGQAKPYSYTLAPEEVGYELSGYGHNAVTPLGMAVRIPIVMSYAIRSLDPGYFWMGGGEVDLKLGMTTEEAEKHFGAIVARI